MASPRNRILSSPAVLLICVFYLFTSALAASAVLGVDLGTEYIKAALVKPGIPLEIVLTKDSRRKEASAVAFKPIKNPQSGTYPERAYGSDAVALAARFPGDVYPNLKPLLGLLADNGVVKDYAARHPALRLETEKTRGTAAFRSGAFAEGEESWTVEEILAMELQSIQKNAEALAGKGSIVRDLVITVPPFYTAEERRAVLLAAELAGLRVLELISDGLAVGVNYATPRTFPDITKGGKPEYHLVFDMGAGSTKATVLKFQGRTVKDIGKFNKTLQEVQVLGTGWDRTLGGDALNAVIVDDMIAQFVGSKAGQKVSATHEEVQSHGRAAAKLWKDAERLRQVLSANTNTQASFEGLYEDADFRYKISRAEFETLSASHASRVLEPIQKALDMAGLTVKDLDSVILHGGSVRTPFVQKALEKFVGSADKVRTNVNADEAAVFGAGFRGAGLSPSFRVKEIIASEAAIYKAGIKWININEKPQRQVLWKPTSYLGAEKQYSFKNQKDFSINFYQQVPSSENVSPESVEKETLTIVSQNLTDSVAVLKEKFACTDGDINVKLSTRLGASNGEVAIIKFIVDCEVEDTEKPGVVDSMKNMFGFGKKDQAPLAEDGESVESISASESNSAETSSSSASSSSSSSFTKSSKDAKSTKEAKEPKKPSKHFEVIPIKFTTEIKGRPELASAEIIRMKERLSAFADSDRSRALREESLNQLEGFTYKARDLLEDEDFITASNSEERASLEAKAKEASDWIYADGRDATRDELKAKLKEMKDIVAPIETRKEEAAGRPEQIKALENALNATKNVIIGIKAQIENDTVAHSSFSSSKSSSATASTTASASADDFADLEDDVTSTISASPEEETLDPPTYTTKDLEAPQKLYDETSAWLIEKLAEQEVLPPTSNPVILVKDLIAKAKELQAIQVDLIMKSMRKPYKPTRKPTSKPKASKSKKAKSSTKTKASGKAGSTPNFENLNKENFINIGEDGQMPTEEELLEFLKKHEADTKEGGQTENVMPEQPAADEPVGEKKHDEL
jgi:hypoxia up-regulated 1